MSKNKLTNLINKNPTVSGIILAVVLIGIGAALILTGFSLKHENAYMREFGVETVGTVTDYQIIDITESDDEEDDYVSVVETRYYAILEYQAEGKTYTWKSTNYSKDKKSYDIGDAVPLIYAPDDPEKVFLPDEYTDSSVLFCFIFGGLLSVFGVFVFAFMVIKGGKKI